MSFRLALEGVISKLALGRVKAMSRPYKRKIGSCLYSGKSKGIRS